MINKLIILSIILILLSPISNGQMIGIRIGIPQNMNKGGGGGGVPNHTITFNSNPVTFNGAYVTYASSP